MYTQKVKLTKDDIELTKDIDDTKYLELKKEYEKLTDTSMLGSIKQFLYRLTHEIDSWTYYMGKRAIEKGVKDCEEIYKKCLTFGKISKITVNIDETRKEPEVIIEYVLDDGEIKVLDMYLSNVLKINKNIDKPIINLKSKFRAEVDRFDGQMWFKWLHSTEIILPENYKDALYGKSYEIVCDLEE